jgi:hypothetical protein
MHHLKKTGAGARQPLPLPGQPAAQLAGDAQGIVFTHLIFLD